jgi:hypothetical protein
MLFQGVSSERFWEKRTGMSEYRFFKTIWSKLSVTSKTKTREIPGYLILTSPPIISVWLTRFLLRARQLKYFYARVHEKLSFVRLLI